ncbi:MAG: hypothetical protein QOJ51_1316 [Acidobacteriaceae bacterium]|jgi:hypothetical protein|nr:hypothetical protein [Acidobacteriaceae bacterium]MEA2258491.1 hypothetical protein [Acidobacteriaceae bacterium]
MEEASMQYSSLPVIATLSFVISPAPACRGTGAQRSGEISVWMPLLGNIFRRSEADLSRSTVERFSPQGRAFLP